MEPHLNITELEPCVNWESTVEYIVERKSEIQGQESMISRELNINPDAS